MIRNILAAKCKQDLALMCEEESYRYADLMKMASTLQCAAGDLQPGDIAAMYLQNSGEFVATLLGLCMLGVVAFPLSSHMTLHETVPLLKQTSARAVITTTAHRSLFAQVQAQLSQPIQVIYIDDLPAPDNECALRESNLPKDVPLVLLTTSGSTGNARIVTLSEANIETSVLGYLHAMAYGKQPAGEIRYLLASPLCSAYGLMILFVCLLRDFPLIVWKHAFTLNDFFHVAQAHAATHYEGGTAVLLQMEQMIGRPIPYDIGKLQDYGFGGSKISGNTLRKLAEAYPNVHFFQGYGMTETAPLITKYANAKMEKLDSVGKAIDGVTIAIATDHGITTAPHATGEVLVRGSNVMLGYYKDTAETDKIIQDGYLHTGDIGYLDEEGYLYICGRKKNAIMVRGFTVYPEDVETCLMESGLLQDCFVYGEVLGDNEVVCANVLPICPDTKAEDILRYCADTLSPHKIPHHIRLVSTIDKVASGKTNRAQKA